LDQLRNSPHSRGGLAEGSLLTLGGVDYGTSIWPPLSGTATEAKAIAAIAPGQHATLAGPDATAAKLKALLPQARYVHLATQGKSKAEPLAAEKKRADRALESRLIGDASRPIAAKNPLGYVGIVLTNGEILSGLGIVALPLAKTDLVT